MIHLENIWEENYYTQKGAIVHQKTDNPFIKEKRKNIIISRAMPVASKKLGITGILDTVEFFKDEKGFRLAEKSGTWKINLVEYKSGEKKQATSDKAQLMAQVFCLEEMFDTSIKTAYLYYHKTNTRVLVPLDANLRSLTLETIKIMHAMYQHFLIPKAEEHKKCRLCSLHEKCMPRLTKKYKNVTKYIYGEIL